MGEWRDKQIIIICAMFSIHIYKTIHCFGATLLIYKSKHSYKLQNTKRKTFAFFFVLASILNESGVCLCMLLWIDPMSL